MVQVLTRTYCTKRNPGLQSCQYADPFQQDRNLFRKKNKKQNTHPKVFLPQLIHFPSRTIARHGRNTLKTKQDTPPPHKKYISSKKSLSEFQLLVYFPSHLQLYLPKLKKKCFQGSEVTSQPTTNCPSSSFSSHPHSFTLYTRFCFQDGKDFQP